MMRGPVVFPDGTPTMKSLLDQRQVDQLGEFVFYDSQPDSEDELVQRIGSAPAIVLGWARISEQILDRCPKLRIISFTGTGVGDFIDVPAATARGVAVANTPGYGDDAVAEHTLLLMLAAARRLPAMHETVARGGWDHGLPGLELAGKRLGIVGLGAIGAKVARLARALDMEVIAWTRRPSPERAAEHHVRFVTLEELFEQSDVVSLHLSLTDDTTHLIGRELLEKMKPGAILVNTARGSVVDTDALVDVLKNGQLLGAALDVFPEEPLPYDHPLRSLDNVVLTPHIGFHTYDATARLLHIALENVIRWFEGSPQNVVNPEVLQSDEKEAENEHGSADSSRS